jgi:16S rRNA (cytosine1402-N4)-methyltransferase
VHDAAADLTEDYDDDSEGAQSARPLSRPASEWIWSAMVESGRQEDGAVHIPVLLASAIEWLAPRRGGRFVDATVGCGGHAQELLQSNEEIELLGIDRDEDALAIAGRRLRPFEGRVHLRKGNYIDMLAFADELGWESVDGILLDAGVSSLQIDRADRGFSYAKGGPLDMRMDRDEALTAAELLNTGSAEDLTFIFRTYGELRQARRLAAAIIERREEKAWSRTDELGELVKRVIGRQKGRHTPVAARAFQAIRIAVNNELENLDIALEDAVDLLAPGGRMVVISFHSLEDRLVKRTFREEALDCVCPPGMPICNCDKEQRLRVLTGKPVTADEQEVAVNSRAACAKLRAAERV